MNNVQVDIICDALIFDDLIMNFSIVDVSTTTCMGELGLNFFEKIIKKIKSHKKSISINPNQSA